MELNITYPTKEKPTRYALPPATGTHSQCFADGNYKGKVTRPTAEEIVAYADGCLREQNEWANQAQVRFPTNNYLRFPVTLTIVPKDKKRFGDLEGAMLFTSDLEGLGISRKVAIPKDLSGWTVSEGGIYVQGDKKLVPYEKWYPQYQWNAKHGSVIALCGVDGAEILERVAKDTGRTNKPSWRVNPNGISEPENRVPVLSGSVRDRLGVDCNGNGNDVNGCAARVLK